MPMIEISIRKENGKPEGLNPLEFACQAPLKFYEHCTKCARFSYDCPYLKMVLELFHRKKKLRYDAEFH